MESNLQDLAGGGEFATILSRSIRRPSLAPPPLSSSLNDYSYDDNDWSLHHVDYSLLNSTLEYFAQRRIGLKSKLCVFNVHCTNSKYAMSARDYSTLMEEYDKIAPFKQSGDGYESSRALGRNPPGAVDVTTTSSTDATDYQNMDTSANLTESQIISRLSHVERTELAALLDKQVEKAAVFYRHRVAMLSPPREEGMFCVSLCGDLDILQCGMEDTPNLRRHSTDNDNGVSVSKPSMMRHTSLESNDLLLAPAKSLTFTELGHELLELHAFITTNIVCVRQILIRYDALARSTGGSPMSSWYQTTRRAKRRGRSSDYRDLLIHSKLVRLSKAYIEEYRRSNVENEPKGRMRGLSRAFYKLVDGAEKLKERQRRKFRDGILEGDEDTSAPSKEEGMIEGMPLEQRTTTPPTYGNWDGLEDDTPLRSDPTPPQPPLYSSDPTTGVDIAYQIYIFKCIQSKTQRSIEKTYNGYISGWWDNTVVTLRDYFLLGSTSDNLSLMPQFLVMRGKSLKSSLLIVAQWREGRMGYDSVGEGEGVDKERWFGGFCGTSRQEDTTADSSDKTSFKSKLALFMNILACFFYMMNYYIVEPSSTRYANALGRGDAMSGLIIGAMPWAALFSAVIYSIWSNRNYRHPLLASGILLTAGNLVYATAYRRNSITMALCGRFMTGLGGPRSMNRRYIADTTPLMYRTSVNAAFGTATAMGAALGPATAIMIDGVDWQFDIPLYGTVYFNGMTGPGFIMCGLWMMFTLVLALTFEEPERSGLEEQKRKEMAQARASAMGVPASLEMSKVGGGASKPDALATAGSNEFVAEHNNRLQASATPYLDESFNCTGDNPGLCTGSDTFDENQERDNNNDKKDTICSQLMFVLQNLTVPVRICMFLLFSKMFTVESVISAASMVTKNRYGWHVQQVGILGTIVGCLTIPISIFIGWVSQYREDRVLMLYLMTFATIGMGLLVDVSDFMDTDTVYYNKGNPLAVGPHRYVAGYLLVFCSVQAFDGVVGSVLSKVIPTALASGTLNSGLLATLVGTFGRACGDVFITSVGFINLRNVMNMLYIPSFCILLLDLIIIWRNYDALTA